MTLKLIALVLIVLGLVGILRKPKKFDRDVTGMFEHNESIYLFTDNHK